MDEDLYQRALTWRGVKEPCATCCGSGVRSYVNTATWRGGIGGSAVTTDVCDTCWGSGDKHNPWTDLRAMERDRAARVTREAADLFAQRLGVWIESARPGLLELAEELDRLAGGRKSRLDHFRRAAQTLAKMLREMVTAADTEQRREAP